VNSTVRTADQTEIGTFWGYDRGGLGPPPILYNHIAQTIALNENNTLEENARLFALLNVAQADAGIAAWETKYVYDLWRPIHAIREADTDGNPLTTAVPDWTPLGAPAGLAPGFTPPFPAYVSGHATFGAAVFRSLANFFGTNSYEFDVRSDELPGVVRHFSSFSEAAEENGRSRIYLGIHYNFDDVYGRAMGDQIADYVHEHLFQPLAAPPVEILAGLGESGSPQARLIDADFDIDQELFPYHSAFTGGVRVAMGDINDDGVDDMITAAGPGGGPHVRVFDGVTGTPIREFMAYSMSFTGGVFVASGDVDGDGVDDIITGAGEGGGPHVRVFSGVSGAEIAGFMAYHLQFAGGVRVAAADVDGDGTAEIITAAGPGGGPHVRALQLDLTELASFYAYHPGFAGGVYVAGGDLDGDGIDEIITSAGAGGGPHVRAFNIATGNVDVEFMAYPMSFTGGVQVAAADFDGDGRDDIITAPGAGQDTTICVFRGYTGVEIDRFRAFGNFGGMVYVAAGEGSSPPALNGAAALSNVTASAQDDLDAVLAAALLGLAETQGGLDSGIPPLRRRLTAAAVDSILADDMQPSAG
jgi:hypothetical protein